MTGIGHDSVWRRCARNFSARGWTASSCRAPTSIWASMSPASAERLAWLTGFTGSAGLAAVLADKAAVFTDGRYVLQLAAQTDPGLWERRHITEDPPPAWLAANAPRGREDRLRPVADQRGGARCATPRPASPCSRWTRNPIDAVWTDRPAPPLAPAQCRTPLDMPGAARRKSASRSRHCCARRSRMRR